MKPEQAPGLLLNDWRRTVGLSQEEVALIVGVSRVAVSHWETSRSAPNGSKLHALFWALELSPKQSLEYVKAISDRGLI